jgi:hypothetical protein
MGHYGFQSEADHVLRCEVVFRRANKPPIFELGASPKIIEFQTVNYCSAAVNAQRRDQGYAPVASDCCFDRSKLSKIPAIRCRVAPLAVDAGNEFPRQIGSIA